MRSIAFCFALLVLAAHGAHAGNWPAWRGPSGDGISDEKDPPTAWTSTENIIWKTALPGGGNSTPAVWEDRVFVTCARENGHVRSVLCFDRNNGKLLWQGDTKFEGIEPTHADNPYCASSPITDGKAVFAWLGSAGMVAYDFQGNQLWHKDLGRFDHIWGNATTPVLYKDALILNCGPGTRCFLIALNRQTGAEIWKRELPEAAGNAKQFKGAWSSPVLSKIDGVDQLIIGLPGYVGGFDPKDGVELWRCRGLGDLVYTNALVGKKVIVVMAGYGGPAIGLRAPGAKDRGDITSSHRLWVDAGKNPQRIGSGVLLDDRVYLMNEPGFSECIEAASGKSLWKARAAGSTWGSTALVDGKLFTCDQSGTTLVWSPGQELTVLHENPLGERVRGSLAFSDGQIFIRGYANLYCIGKAPGTPKH